MSGDLAEHKERRMADVVMELEDGTRPSRLTDEGYTEHFISEAVATAARINVSDYSDYTTERAVIKHYLEFDRTPDELVEKGFEPIDVSCVVVDMFREGEDSFIPLEDDETSMEEHRDRVNDEG